MIKWRVVHKELLMSNTMLLVNFFFKILIVVNLLNHTFSIKNSNLITYYQVKLLYLIINQKYSIYIQHTASHLVLSFTFFLPIDGT